MSFLKILVSVCRGTEIFPFLVRIPIIKALFHFLLLAFICTSFIALAKLMPVWNSVYSACEILNREFGAFLVSGENMLPQKAPEQSRSVMVSKTFLVDYQTDKKLSVMMEDEATLGGMIWTPLFLGGWTKVKPDTYVIMPIVYNVNVIRMPMYMSKAELQNYISSMSIKPSAFPFAFLLESIQIKNFITAVPVFTFIMLCGIFGINLFLIVTSTIIFGSIFSIVYAFMKDPASRISGINIFVITIYASFPPVIIASFFPALELPYIDYQTVHMFALLIYLFIVFNKVQQYFAPKKKDEDEIDF